MDLKNLLEKYPPTEINHHKQLFYLADNLNENELKKYVDLIFSDNGVLLASEIGAKSSFSSITEFAKHKLDELFILWLKNLTRTIQKTRYPKINNELREFKYFFESYSFFDFSEFLEILSKGTKANIKDRKENTRQKLTYRKLFLYSISRNQAVSEERFEKLLVQLLNRIMSDERTDIISGELFKRLLDEIAFSTIKNKLSNTSLQLIEKYNSNYVKPDLDKNDKSIFRIRIQNYVLLNFIITKNGKSAFKDVNEKIKIHLNEFLSNKKLIDPEVVRSENNFIRQLCKLGYEFPDGLAYSIVDFELTLFKHEIESIAANPMYEEYHNGYYRVYGMQKITERINQSIFAFYKLLPHFSSVQVSNILYDFFNVFSEFINLQNYLDKDSHVQSYFKFEAVPLDDKKVIKEDSKGTYHKINLPPYNEGFIHKKRPRTYWDSVYLLDREVLTRHFSKLKSVSISPVDLTSLKVAKRFDISICFFEFERFIISQIFMLLNLKGYNPFYKNHFETLNNLGLIYVVPEIHVRNSYQLKLKPVEIAQLLKKFKPKFYRLLRTHLINSIDDIYAGMRDLISHQFDAEILFPIKNGFAISINGVIGFLPKSQIWHQNYNEISSFKTTMELLQVDTENNSYIASVKTLFDKKLVKEQLRTIDALERGQVLKGTVKNIVKYGVFVDLGGVDGLIHNNDLSWGRVNHPEEIVRIDQELEVVILDSNSEKKRIALGLKQLEPHPWDSLDGDLNVGDKVKGKVVVMADYGAIVEIAPGVEGLIHVSEMSWSQHLRSARDFLNVGDEVEAVILTLDREERKMSLGIKQLMPDPWEGVESKYAVHTQHTAKVHNFTNFGVFVELEEGVDGLIHISDLSWQKKIMHPSEFYSVGEPIEVVVLEMDREGRKISLGHKQLKANPWEKFESTFMEGSTHEGTVIEKKDKSVIVSLPYGFEAICPKRHMHKEDGSNVEVGETLDFVVIKFNKDGRKIVVSHVLSHETDLPVDLFLSKNSYNNSKIKELLNKYSKE